MDILDRLEHEPSYCEHSDARQLRHDAAEEIRAQRRQIAELENLVRRARSDKMSRRAA